MVGISLQKSAIKTIAQHKLGIDGVRDRVLPERRPSFVVTSFEGRRSYSSG